MRTKGRRNLTLKIDWKYLENRLHPCSSRSTELTSEEDTTKEEQDTIFGGQWGNVVNYKLIKIKEKEYLNTYYNYGFPMGQTVMVYKIHSIEENNFLEPIFEKTFELYRETHRKYNDVPTNFIFDRKVDVKIKKGIEFDIKLQVSYCPEIEGEQCDVLFEESYVDFYNIN